MQSVGPRRTTEAPRFIEETTCLSHAQGLQYLGTLQGEQSDAFKNNKNKQMDLLPPVWPPFYLSYTRQSGHSSYTTAPLKLSVLDFPGGPVVGNLPANAGDTGSIPDPGRFHVSKILQLSEPAESPRAATKTSAVSR